MKTIEEKAEEYAEETILALYSDSELMQDFVQKLKKYAKIDFLAGYNEAMRWRDPKIELPEYYKKVEIKIKRDDVVDYVNASLLAEDDDSLFFGDYNFVIFIKLKDVIGWRPIE